MRFVKPYTWEVIITIIIGIFKFAIPLFIPLLIKIVIDDIIGATDLTSAEKTTQLFWWLGGTIFVFFVIRPPIEYFRQYLAQHVSNKVLYDVRREIHQHLQKLSLRFYANSRTGDIISRTINDVEQTKNFVVTGLMNVWLDLATILIAVGIMLTLNVELTIVALIVFPFYALSVRYFFGKLRALTRERSKSLAGVQSYLHERVAGMSVVKSFTLEEREQENFAKVNGEFLDASLKQTRWNAKSFAVINTITDVAPLLVIGYAGYQVIHGHLSVGTMVAFIAYIERLYSPLRRLVSASTTLTQAIASMDRMFELMDEPHEIKDKKGAQALVQARGDITFDNVSFKYDAEGSEILHNVNFTVQAGETVAFVGMSGGGKSTIVNLIPRFYEVSAGAVVIDGKDVRDITIKSLREQIGLVLQDTILFSDTIRENILMGRPNATEQQMIEAAKAANAHDFIMSLPHGYDTTVGERGVKLSGGQKQRVAIARVFLKNPAILVLDEATSALDLESEALIQDSVEKLAANRTTIIIAHRLSTITHADRIIVISHGKVTEQGTHQELLHQQGAYYDLYKIQNLTI